MRETLNISQFVAGMVSTPDQEDIPIEAAIYSINTDPDATEGKLKNIKQPLQSALHGSTCWGARHNKFIQRDTGERDLIFYNGENNQIVSVLDFDGSPSAMSIGAGSTAAITIHNQNAHIGAGIGYSTVWAGYVNLNIFGGISNQSIIGTLGCYVIGKYTGTVNRNYRVEIDSNGTPDTFRWSDTGGSSWNATGVPITGGNQSLNYGLSVRFNATTGNTIGDALLWTAYYFLDTLQYEPAMIMRPEPAQTPIDIVSISFSTSGNEFESGRRYRWAVSLIYDGYQEGPLGVPRQGTPGANYGRATVTIRANGAASGLGSYSKRLTALRLYRASEDASGNYGFYRYVTDIEVEEILYSSIGSWYTTTNHNNYEIQIEDEGNTGPSYEANTGISETLLRTMVDYSLSEVLNSQLFVGKCALRRIIGYADKYELPDADFYLFRSKPLRYDIFDWTEDLLRLPYIPKAMSSYAGRLFVFCDNVIYKINPDGFFIEDIIYNMSVINDRSVITTDAGMFWCDMENIYMYDGRQIIEIGNLVKTTDYSAGISWQDLIGSNIKNNDYNKSVFVQYYEKKNIVLFAVVKSTNICYAFSYHLGKRKWDYITVISSSSTSGFISNLDGILYVITDPYIYRLFASASYYSFQWISGELPKGELGQLKKFYKVLTDSTNITVQYSINGGSTWRNLTAGEEIKDVGGDWEHKKTIMIKLVSGGTTYGECSNLELIFRRMIGKR